MAIVTGKVSLIKKNVCRAINLLKIVMKRKSTSFPTMLHIDTSTNKGMRSKTLHFPFIYKKLFAKLLNRNQSSTSARWFASTHNIQYKGTLFNKLVLG